MEEIKLNIGAGHTYIPGFKNIDIVPWADIVLDLDREKLPFEDNTVASVFSYHALEHFSNYLKVLAEVYRVLRHGGSFFAGVPYVTLTEYHLVNPYHKQNFNEFSFDFFDLQRLKGSAAEQNPITFRKVFHRFHYLKPFGWFPPFLQASCRRHLLNVVQKIDFGLIAIKDPKVVLGDAALSPRESMKQFDLYLNARVPYPPSRKEG